jgi:hypothetical protein
VVVVKAAAAATTATEPTIFSGEPPERARAADLRRAVAGEPFYSVAGDRIDGMNELIGDPDDPSSGTSVVVFLRSLG